MNCATKIDNRCLSYCEDKFSASKFAGTVTDRPVRLTVHPRFDTNDIVDETDASADYSKWTDEALLLEFRVSKRRELFEELVQRYERDLFNYLRRYMDDIGNVEDVFQLTFMQVYLKCEQFESGRKFRPWLYSIATNKAIDLHRKTNKRFRLISIDEASNTDSGMTLGETVESNTPDPLSDSINDEEAQRVRKAMEKLPENLRQTLYLVYFQGLPYREAAETLGIPFGTIKSRLNQAIHKLNTILKN
ncbi:MAG: RNA polymerase sigma factor [Planctomycetaceae bacterium]|jgi:RNA polymerase sigma-70 factor (ECF subfamily)|nr:RNA polymerase sigma factor [Planctomycetaceae bacterium]